MMTPLFPSKSRPARPNVTESVATLWFPTQVHIFRHMCGRFDNLIARDAHRGPFKAHCLQELRDCLTELADNEKGVAS